MTQEEKQLLTQDLCARLPYGLHATVRDPEENDDFQPFEVLGIKEDLVWVKNTMIGVDHFDTIEVVKPYLRPMSSMTEKEKNELRNILWFGYPSDDNDKYSHRGIEVKQCLYDDEKHSTYDFDDFITLQNFLLKNNFDYHGLIEKGLALEAPRGLYKS